MAASLLSTPDEHRTAAMLWLPVSSRRRLGLVLVIVTIVLGALGTQAPFEYRTSAFALQRHWDRVDWSWWPRTRRGHVEIDDLVMNLVMLVPLGVGWALWRTHARLRVLVESVLVGGAVSVVYEAAQLLTRNRYTQLADIWRNAAGCAVGCAAGLAFMALAGNVFHKRVER